MTVGELIEHLKQFDKNLPVASLDVDSWPIEYDEGDFEVCDYLLGSKQPFLKISVPNLGKYPE